MQHAITNANGQTVARQRFNCGHDGDGFFVPYEGWRPCADCEPQPEGPTPGSLADEVQEFYARQAVAMTPEQRRAFADVVAFVAAAERPVAEG